MNLMNSNAQCFYKFNHIDKVLSSFEKKVCIFFEKYTLNTCQCNFRR